MRNNTHPYRSVCRPSLRSRRAEQRCCCRHSEGQDWLYCEVRPEVDWTRHQLDKDGFMTRHPCHVSWPGGGLVGRNGSLTGGTGETEVCGKCSVPHGPVALGYGARDLQEGRAHHVEGLVGKRWHILRCHPLRLDLWQDLQFDDPCRGTKLPCHKSHRKSAAVCI